VIDADAATQLTDDPERRHRHGRKIRTLHESGTRFDAVASGSIHNPEGDGRRDLTAIIHEFKGLWGDKEKQKRNAEIAEKRPGALRLGKVRMANPWRLFAAASLFRIVDSDSCRVGPALSAPLLFSLRPLRSLR